MKRIVTIGLAALMLAASAGFAGYAISSRNADTPDCCKNKEACCPGSSCCSQSHRHSPHRPIRT